MNITINNNISQFEPKKFIWKDLTNHRSALIALGIIILLILSSFLSSSLTRYDPIEQGDLIKSRYLSPSWEHPFGTDKFGRDVFSRALFASQISITIGFFAILVLMSLLH